MRKNIKKAVCIFFAVLLLVCSFPLSAFALDPVSAGVIANSFAQAITAYGAANGVSLTFDVANADGIGESVHELWTAFRTGTQSADDWDTLAAALFPDLYYKAERALAGATTAAYVGLQISSAYAEEFDNFYNWLLSGPAEMVQVDNQYYQFSSAQIGADAVPLNVYRSFPFSSLPTLASNLSDASFYSSAYPVCTTSFPREYHVAKLSGSSPVYVCTYGTGNIAVFSVDTFSTRSVAKRTDSGVYLSEKPSGVQTWTVDGVVYCRQGYGSSNIVQSFVPHYADLASAQAAFVGAVNGTGAADTLGIKASTAEGVADFPDTADPNYDAIHRAKNIPLDEPWNDTLYGDGTGTLTDAQSEAISGALDDTLIAAGELDLVGEETADPTPPDPDDDPSDDPGDYGVLGLDDVFPFCIPFDIYNFLSALVATPTPPHFTATLAFPAAVGGNQTIDIDFDNPTFNQLARLLRLLELLAFIVGLALLTRSMFIRG